MNSTKLKETQGSFKYMTISSDFREFDIDGEINKKNYRILNFVELDIYDELNIATSSKKSSENNITIGYPLILGSF